MPFINMPPKFVLRVRQLGQGFSVDVANSGQLSAQSGAA
jgi:hypothetical protein